MISTDQALEMVLQSVTPLGAERVPLVAGLGRVLAEEIRTPRDVPGFDNSAMDGYALRTADVERASESNPVRLVVVETVGAGRMPTRTVEPGQAIRTMTGAPIARGADAVVPLEQTRDGGSTVDVLAPAEPGGCIRPRGEDLRAGDLVMDLGRLLRPAEIGMLAALSRSIIEVCRRPRIAIVATGDELVDVDQVPSGAQIVNSSAYALAAAVIEAGSEPTILKVARDRREEIRDRLCEAIRFDMVLSTGGVSAGHFDHVKGVLDELGMATVFHGVAQKPGRPLKFGLLEGRPVFGLPGNPVSTMVCFYLYVRPAVLRMGGRRSVGLPRVKVTCAVDIRLANNLTEFVRVKLDQRGEELYASPAGGQGSGILSSLARADALLIGPAREPILKAGRTATALLLNPQGAADTEAFFEERRFHKN